MESLRHIAKVSGGASAFDKLLSAQPEEAHEVLEFESWSTPREPPKAPLRVASPKKKSPALKQTIPSSQGRTWQAAPPIRFGRKMPSQLEPQPHHEPDPSQSSEEEPSTKHEAASLRHLREEGAELGEATDIIFKLETLSTRPPLAEATSLLEQALRLETRSALRSQAAAFEGALAGFIRALPSASARTAPAGAAPDPLVQRARAVAAALLSLASSFREDSLNASLARSASALLGAFDAPEEPLLPLVTRAASCLEATPAGYAPAEIAAAVLREVVRSTAEARKLRPEVFTRAVQRSLKAGRLAELSPGLAAVAAYSPEIRRAMTKFCAEISQAVAARGLSVAPLPLVEFLSNLAHGDACASEAILRVFPAECIFSFPADEPEERVAHRLNLFANAAIALSEAQRPGTVDISPETLRKVAEFAMAGAASLQISGSLSVGAMALVDGAKTRAALAEAVTALVAAGRLEDKTGLSRNHPGAHGLLVLCTRLGELMGLQFVAGVATEQTRQTLLKIVQTCRKLALEIIGD
eukprot:gnl/Chilomastix_cuspidata/5282.p1 GENE.gnl/Chilomastix_cuspidata/5282~~gnl/Chilomastix_cuspidata/5282.p1  ORF type:complete len:540 (+),score=123.29 gnl/Chilomastix_cuspidata/5282:42-1622(+)